MKDHLSEKLYRKGKTEEDRYFTEYERKLIKKLRDRDHSAPPKTRKQKDHLSKSHQGEGNVEP